MSSQYSVLDSVDVDRPDSNFRYRVEIIVGSIPLGRVMSYGQIAALAGSPRAARIVGGIAHYGNPELPWQRVVNKSGGLARGYPGGLNEHKTCLELEGMAVSDQYQVDISKLLWWPPDSGIGVPEDPFNGSSNNAILKQSEVEYE